MVGGMVAVLANCTSEIPHTGTTFDILKDVASTPYTVYTLPVAQIGLFGEIALGELGD
jgi:hypothetical protein